jgi:hypothetical protein
MSDAEDKIARANRRARKIDAWIEDLVAMEQEEARRAGALGYMSRVLVQATLPHSDPGDVKVWGKDNGVVSLSIQAGAYLDNGEPRSVGYPFGTYPRLLLAWVTTEAVRTKSPVLTLGPSLSAFMAQLDITPTGGRWGTITRLRDQMKRLFSARISATYNDPVEGRFSRREVPLVDEQNYYWDPMSPDQATLWNSNITLSTKFFEEITKRPVPIDLRAIKLLKSSSVQLDLYTWLTYRMSYLRKPVKIPWAALMTQFGSGYPDTRKGRNNFQQSISRHLKKVLLVYPDAKVSQVKGGLLLKPSPTHVQLPPRTQ